MDSTPNTKLRILITGVTGFVGSELLRYILNAQAEQCERIFILIRDQGHQTAAKRFDLLQDYWRRYVNFNHEHLEKVELVSGDLLGLSETQLPENLDLVFHCAASTDFAKSVQLNRLANVDTTRALVEYCQRHSKSDTKIMHFSTAFVANCMKGDVAETLSIPKFGNSYEQTKYESELVVRGSGLRHVILRPTIIVGDSETGYVKGFKVLYSLLRIWLTGRMSRIPLDRHALVDIVPIDYVVKATWVLAFNKTAENQIIHLSAGRRACSPVALMTTAFAEFDLPKPKFVLFIFARILAKPWIQPFIGHNLRSIVHIAKWHLPYLGKRRRVFLNAKAEALLAAHGISYPPSDAFHRKLFEFCKESNWGKKPKCSV